MRVTFHCKKKHCVWMSEGNVCSRNPCPYNAVVIPKRKELEVRWSVEGVQRAMFREYKGRRAKG